MRLVLTYENHMSPLPFFFEPGAFRWTERKIPVAWEASWREPEGLLGSANDFYRTIDGAITCEFKPNARFKDHEELLRQECGATLYCNMVQEREDTGLRIIRGALIQAVFFTTKVPWNSFLED